MTTYTSLSPLFAAVAAAIRTKTGGSSEIIADDFPAAIADISARKQTGTFTGDGSRQAVVSCPFEPDLVYWTSDPGTSASSGTVSGVITRGMLAANLYRNNTTTNSNNIQVDITDMNTGGSSYNFKATYADGKVTIYCHSSGARSLFTNSRSYSYTFIKWTI